MALISQGTITPGASFDITIPAGYMMLELFTLGTEFDPVPVASGGICGIKLVHPGGTILTEDDFVIGHSNSQGCFSVGVRIWPGTASVKAAVSGNNAGIFTQKVGTVTGRCTAIRLIGLIADGTESNNITAGKYKLLGLTDPA